MLGNSAAERKGQGENRGMENPFFPSWEPKWCDSLPQSMNKHRPCPKKKQRGKKIQTAWAWEPPKSLKHLGHCFLSFLWGVANTNTAFSSFLQGQKQPEEYDLNCVVPVRSSQVSRFKLLTSQTYEIQNFMLERNILTKSGGISQKHSPENTYRNKNQMSGKSYFNKVVLVFWENFKISVLK